MNVIPPITDPMGRHWRQPDLSKILIDDTHCLMNESTFRDLPEYSTSTPSGVYDGKAWRAERMMPRPGFAFTPTGEWFLRWYAPSKNPDKCVIETRRILFE